MTTRTKECETDGGIYISEFASDPSVEEMLPRFLSDLPAKWERIATASAAEDWPAMARHVHQLRGSSGMYGFVFLSELCGLLEASLTEGTIEPAVIEAIALRVKEFCTKLFAYYAPK